MRPKQLKVKLPAFPKTQSKMTPPFKPMFPSNVITCTTDRRADFTLQDDQTELTQAQKEFLFTQVKCELPDPVNIRQVHGDEVLVVDDQFPRKGAALPEADGLMTKSTRLPLAVRSADCLPVFLYDQASGGIGMVHVGWKGARKNILGKTVKLMETQWQTDASEIRVYFGPSICSRCYEVGLEFNEYFPGELIARDARFYLDLQEINRSRLIHAGVLDDSIIDSEICTCCDKNYFSHRRDKERAGRMLSLIAIND